VAGITLVWSHLTRLPGPIQFVLVLAAFASTLGVISFALSIRERHKLTLGVEPVPSDIMQPPQSTALQPRAPAAIRVHDPRRISGNQVDVEQTPVLGVDIRKLEDSLVSDNEVRLSSHPESLASQLSDQFLRATKREMPLQIRAYREGIVIAATQLQNGEKALPARIVVSDIRKLQDGKRITSRMFHSDGGQFSYHAIQLERVPGTEGDLHYGDEGLWWIVRPINVNKTFECFGQIARRAQPSIAGRGVCCRAKNLGWR
jgi:hypothetical protein